MYDSYKEASLPITYRRKETACVTAALVLDRSVQVVGLSGTGKSNLLRFLISHPQLLKNNADFLADDVCFLYIDCNKLYPINVLNFYRECYSQLQGQADPPALADEYLLYKQLELGLRELDSQTLVVLVVDRAEVLHEKMGREFFGQLRNLRDEARGGRMAFVFGCRRPLEDLYDLEKLFSDVCWVGPLSVADRSEFFARHEERLKFTVDQIWQEKLWRLTGGHPGLLKNGLEWLKRQGGENLPEDEMRLSQALLAYVPLQKHCQGLWDNLTRAEQNFLWALEHDPPVEAPIEQLKKSGTIIHKTNRWIVFSPLWKAYLEQHVWPSQAIEPMQIELDSATRRVILRWRGKKEETVITRNLVFELLRLLSTTPNQIYSKDELISALYKDEEAYETFDDALFQLITALRKLLDKLVKRLCPEMVTSCIQNVRGVGYRLVVDLPVNSKGNKEP